MIAASHPGGQGHLTLIVGGNEDRCIVTALFDNLGKGPPGRRPEYESDAGA